MIQNHSDISSPGSHLLNCETGKQNDSELYRLIHNSTQMTNTAEKKANHIVHISGGADTATKTGTLKYLLIGVTILTGIGALAAGGYYYMVGRPSSGGRPENMLSAHLSLSATDNITPWQMDNHASTISANTLTNIMNSQPVTQTTSSPYSYYEGVYGSTASLNNNPPSIPVTLREIPLTTTEKLLTTTERPTTTTQKPVTTTGNPASAYMAAKPTTTSSPDRDETAVTEYKHDSGRSVYYKTVNGKYNYPLGTKFFNELISFCLAETQYEIGQAYRGTPELRCQLLDDINNKIAALKEYETVVRRVNAEKETLSVKEHGEEIMLRRQLATLYLAAEAIINKKDFNVFLREVNRDYKNHSTKELSQREEKIMNYFPEEC